MSKKKAKPISQSVYSYAFTHSYSMNLRTHVQKRLIVWLMEYDFKMSFNVGCKVHIVFHIIRIKCMGWKKNNDPKHETNNEWKISYYILYICTSGKGCLHILYSMYPKYCLKRLNLHHTLNKFSRRQTDVIFLFFIFVFQKNRIWHFMQIISIVKRQIQFSGKKNKKTYFNILPAENFTQHAKR